MSPDLNGVDGVGVEVGGGGGVSATCDCVSNHSSPLNS